ncbi:hypothetical protein QYF36_012005 [Acer negundo]|nr:hypothetical protein QYF36_012005 [Acer negundo]
MVQLRSTHWTILDSSGSGPLSFHCQEKENYRSRLNSQNYGGVRVRQRPWGHWLAEFRDKPQQGRRKYVGVRLRPSGYQESYTSDKNLFFKL